MVSMTSSSAPLAVVPAAARTISPSQITTYLMCPRLYRFRYIEKFLPEWKASGLAFGSAMHAAIEAWQMSRLSGDEMPAERVIATFLNEWEAEKAGEIKLKDDEDMSVLEERGIELLKLFMAVMKDEPPAAAELAFEVPLHDPETGEDKGIRLRGIFDLVLAGDRVVEVKTAAKSWSEQEAARHLQLTAYSFAYEQLRGRIPSLEVVALVKTKQPKLQRLTTVRTSEEHEWFLTLVHEVSEAIDARVFPPNPGWACPGCEHGARCKPIGVRQVAWRGMQ